MNTERKEFSRQHDITTEYLNELDKHLLDIVEGRKTIMYEIRDFANIMHIHPTHLSNTVKLTTGNHPCYYFEEKILNISKSMLEKNENSISQIATLLTYDPSNFTKFFKKFANMTPKKYREDYMQTQRNKKTEMLTI
ncbi:helix-turn-helix domain-containing protein [Flavobacterium sp.]|jgi:AraC family transcriptional regulator of adaptative response / methylphosphotriester-DNA alkyltransferase methyltransferase|uniref:helix-turn-helix domain-containing protein n=1 Tax=Flavobacterium sp. TaxID=239 RepID=UPI0038FC48DD